MYRNLLKIKLRIGRPLGLAITDFATTIYTVSHNVFPRLGACATVSTVRQRTEAGTPKKSNSPFAASEDL